MSKDPYAEAMEDVTSRYIDEKSMKRAKNLLRDCPNRKSGVPNEVTCWCPVCYPVWWKLGDD